MQGRQRTVWVVCAAAVCTCCPTSCHARSSAPPGSGQRTPGPSAAAGPAAAAPRAAAGCPSCSADCLSLPHQPLLSHPHCRCCRLPASRSAEEAADALRLQVAPARAAWPPAAASGCSAGSLVLHHHQLLMLVPAAAGHAAAQHVHRVVLAPTSLSSRCESLCLHQLLLQLLLLQPRCCC